MTDDVRLCEVCNKSMTQGYCIGDGAAYYCSDECLHKEMSHEEYMELYKDGYAYWTEWES